MRFDYAELDIPGASHPLLLSSRPGFVSGAGKEGIKAFCAYFRRAGVTAMTVLMTSPELRLTFGGVLFDHYRKAGFRIIHCPIEDFSVPENMESFDGCIDEIQEALQHGSVLMHCAAGLGRTGLAAACLLVRCGLEWREALARVRDVRPGAAQTHEQEDFIARYAQYFRR